MDVTERAAVRDEGYDPDAPDVVAVLNRVRAEVAAVGCAVIRQNFVAAPPQK
jgi:hypothetical protein